MHRVLLIPWNLTFATVFCLSRQHVLYQLLLPSVSLLSDESTVTLDRDRCFAAAGPKLWNRLPAEHCDKVTLTFSCNDLKQLLKTCLCSGAEIAAYCD